MRFDLPFTEADVRRALQVPLSPHIVANATFEGVRANLGYWMFHLRPVLQGMVNQTRREQAVLTLFYRVVGYLTSIWKVAGPTHFQTIAAAARSIFELGLDLTLFAQDQTDDSLDRLDAFTRVERYRVAAKIVDFYSARPLPRDFDITQQRATVANIAETRAVEDLVRQYWGVSQRGNLNWPKHWSRFQDARRRAQHTGGEWEDRYVRNYYGLSWHIHAGLAGVANLPREAFDIFAAQAHELAANVSLDCFEVVGAELHLAAAIAEWVNQLRFLRSVKGMALVDLRLHSIGEPVRFLYFEPQERL